MPAGNSEQLDADVAVVGLGTMGALTAWQLARRGARVLGFERFAPGHDRGSAGGETRIFRTAYHEGPEYVPLLRRSLADWRILERETGRRLLTLTGGLMLGPADSPFLSGVLGSAREHGLEVEVLDRGEVRRRYPQHVLGLGEIAVLDRAAGFLRPELAVAAVARRARELGARLLVRTPVTGVEADGGGVTIRSGDRCWRTARAVLALGAWTGRPLPGGLPAIQVQRLVMAWFLAEDPARFSADRFPIFIHRAGRHDISGCPSQDGVTVKVGLNLGWDVVEDPSRLDRGVADDHPRLLALREAVRELLPGLHPEPVRLSAYQDGYTGDRQALVGWAPGLPGTVVLGGFSGHGFKLAPAIARIAADLVLDGGTELPADHLFPGRPVPPPAAEPLPYYSAEQERGPRVRG